MSVTNLNQNKLRIPLGALQKKDPPCEHGGSREGSVPAFPPQLAADCFVPMSVGSNFQKKAGPVSGCNGDRPLVSGRPLWGGER